MDGTAGSLFRDAEIGGDFHVGIPVETIARTSHLLLPFPDSIRNDMAFHDRWHAYLPGWEMPKMQPGYFTSHMGFIADYIAEIFHTPPEALCVAHGLPTRWRKLMRSADRR